MPRALLHRLCLATGLAVVLSGCFPLTLSLNLPMPLPPPSVTLTPTRLVIYGSIVHGLDRIVRSMPSSVKLVVLDSPGGMSVPGDRMAQEFRRRGITAYVPQGGSCFSACAIMLAGAVNRIVHPTAQVMVHGRMMANGALTARTERALTRENTETARQMIAWGINGEYVINALKLPRDKYERFLNAQSALRVGLATAVGVIPEGDAMLNETCRSPPLGTLAGARRLGQRYSGTPPELSRNPRERDCPSWQPQAP